MTTAYVQMVAALVFVILLIVGAGYLVRKKQNRFGLMDVVSYQSIGPKKGVAALKVGREILILGVTANEMRLLKTFRDDELEVSQSNGFADRLDKFRETGSDAK